MAGPARRRPSIRALALLALALSLASTAEARTRKFCVAEPYYSGKDVACGGHLQPQCTGSLPCDAGHNAYSGPPFPIVIDCPTIRDPVFGIVIYDVPDVTVNGGCYDRVPTCESCGGLGEPPCPAVAEPVCSAGCDEGLEPDELTTLCEPPGTPGSPCGPGYPCSDGLVCDPFAGFRCVELADAGESCANPFVKCGQGLQCTLALECSHEPAREGETCDATAPCGNGLFCQAGIPQRCQVYRKPGEGCSVVNPCIEGASCEPCFTDKCHSPFQCFWNANNGAITEQQCRALYSPGDSQAAVDAGITLTYSAGWSVAGLVGSSQAVGFAYGHDGRYGCFETLCYGINLDASVEAFISVGFNESFDSVGGESFATFEEVQLPGGVLNYATSQVFERTGPIPGDGTIGRLVGSEDSFAVGAGPNPIPVSGGGFVCETTLDVLSEDGEPPPPPPPAPPPVSSRVVNPGFDVDLEGWSCTNGGICDWIEDDPEASTLSGSGQITSGGGFDGLLESSCVSVEEGEVYEFSAWAKTTGVIGARLYALWSSSDGCAGGVVGNETVGLSTPDNTWRHFSTELVAPPAARTVKFKINGPYDPATDTPGTSRLDTVVVPEPSSGLVRAVALAVVAGIELSRRARARGGPWRPPCGS